MEEIMARIEKMSKQARIITGVIVLVLIYLLLESILGPKEMGNLLYLLPGLLIAITVHEMAHALMAYIFGDDTSKHRITLNPLKHLDMLGTLMLLIFKFGWAKPVEVNPRKMTKTKLSPKTKEVLVALVGPISNILVALTLILIAKNVSIQPGTAISSMFALAIYINIGLAVFNLLPIPPLDGYSIVKVFLGENLKRKIEERSFEAMIILLLLVNFTGLGRVIADLIRSIYLTLII